jgi:integrase/recombinase XerD
MLPSENNLRIRLVSSNWIDREIEAFLIDRQARGLSPRTIHYYRQKLGLFHDYLEASEIKSIDDITPRLIRRFLVDLAASHNAGGVHGIYRALRAWLNWYEEEEDDNWPNPIRKVHPPKVPQQLLDPLSLDDLKAMLSTCTGHSFANDRDRAMLLALLDTGCRRAEFCGLNLADVNLSDGSVLIRHGKGDKPRVVFLGAKSRKALMNYLRHRPKVEGETPLWVTAAETRLSYAGLREVIRRRARAAGIVEPSLHSFRRAFALSCLRNHVDVFALQRLMGHSDLSVLRRYLAQTEEDLRQAHARGGPVDNLLQH